MCGISAVFRYSELAETDLEKLGAMNQEMWYRGPDDESIWSDEKCGLAHTRLSIIGLDNGAQPLFNEDKSLVLICNGEIYNYLELQEDLIKKGHQLTSDSDCETILHLYEEHGTDCVKFLRGQFAFCLWDITNKRLMIARDRIGEKTLYYAQIPGGFVCSSELKVILKNYITHPQINAEQLAGPIRYTAPLSKLDTFIDQIKRVEPGQYVLCDNEGMRKYHYWKRDSVLTFSGTFGEAKEQTLDLMREAVSLSLRSDVPVAVMLSGGVDSSAIACLAREAEREVHTITAGYKGKHDVDEREVAKKLAKEKGFTYHEVELDETDFNHCFEEFTEHIDEPITDSAAIAQWALYKKVKSLGFKVLLGGMGGDELFYGYPYWNELGKSLEIHRRHQAFFPWQGIEKKKSYARFLINNLKYVLHAGYPKKIEDGSVCKWMYEDYCQFANQATFRANGHNLSFDRINLDFTFRSCEPGREIDIIYDFSFDHIMTMAYLYLSDRLGMGNSIEIRSPLLDYKLVEYVSSLPLKIKYKDGEPKYFMKQVLSGIVPDYILYGPKKGFTPPPTFIKDVVSNYQYQMINADHKFYNSILADRILELLVKRDEKITA